MNEFSSVRDNIMKELNNTIDILISNHCERFE